MKQRDWLVGANVSMSALRDVKSQLIQPTRPMLDLKKLGFTFERGKNSFLYAREPFYFFFSAECKTRLTSTTVTSLAS